jgi:hemerythrin superfamily protein
MPDAITMLKADHTTVNGLFRQFEKLRTAGTGGERERRDVVRQIVRELSIHAVVEEQAFYPAIRKAIPDLEDTILESLEEHHVVKWTCSELENMEPSEERFDAKVTVLMESVRHHVEEEENEFFPKVREALGRKALVELGETMEQVKHSAPETPQPRASDTPPAGAVPDIRPRTAATGSKNSGLLRRRKSPA